MAGTPKSPASPSAAPKSPATPAAPGTALAGQSSPPPATTALVPDETPDVFFDGDSVVSASVASDSTSLRSSILRYRQENGRTYHSYKDGSYVFPNDDTESERLDLQHDLLHLTFGGLHISTFEKEPQRVLDAGTGTGIWAIEYADNHPEAHVTGIDLSAIQPSFVPPNVTFYVDDLEDSWEYSAKFDFIFARMLTGSILDWPKFFRQAYDNLEPGGVIELQDISYPLSCDDGTLPDDSPIKKWSILLRDALAAIGRGPDSALHYRQQLEDAGFVDIVEVHEKWPSNWWPKDQRYKQLGIWNHENLTQGLPALSLAMFTRPKEEGGLGWSSIELEVLLAGVRNDFRNTNYHAYWPVLGIHAKKPKQG